MSKEFDFWKEAPWTLLTVSIAILAMVALAWVVDAGFRCVEKRDRRITKLEERVSTLELKAGVKGLKLEKEKTSVAP